VGGVGIQKRKNIIYIIYYAEGAREDAAAVAERYRFLTNPNLIIICTREYIRVPQAV